MNKKYKRFVELSWKILEYKFMYYHPDRVDPKFHEALTISDFEYDKLESEYKSLCQELNKKSTATDMIGFPVSKGTTPSTDIIVKKYGKWTNEE